MTIENKATIREPHVDDMRSAIEHRATWMYLLMDEARKRGLGWDDFARAAVLRCGRFHGDAKFEKTDDLTVFSKSFANELYRKIFEMDMKEVTKDRFVVEFHYCPLVAAWKKQTNDEKDIEKLCDIAMDGDRGIVSMFPDFEFALEETIAQGKPICRIVITRKKR